MYDEPAQIISWMTYQPKSMGKMADFELPPSDLSKVKSNVHLFLPGLSLRYKALPVPVKKFDSQPSSVYKLILLPTSCCDGLDVA